MRYWIGFALSASILTTLFVGCGATPAASSATPPASVPGSTPSLVSTPQRCYDGDYGSFYKMVSDISDNHSGATFTLAEAVVGAPIDNYTITTVPFSSSAHNYWSLSTLPPGIVLDPVTGKLSGTPTTNQLSGTTVTVVDDYHDDFNNAKAQRSCNFTYHVQTTGATKTFTPTGAMSAIRSDAVAVALSSASNAKVLVLGGNLQTAELFDPATGTLTATAGTMTRYGAQFATLLQSGKILISGGFMANGTTPELRLELYDPLTQTFSLTGSSVASAPAAAILLPSGNVMFLEGTDRCDVSTGATVHHMPQIYNAGTNVVANAPGGVVGGANGVLLASGSVLIRSYQSCFQNAVFGNWYNVFLGATRLYDPVGASTTSTGASYVYGDNSAPVQKGGLRLADGTVIFNDYGVSLNGDDNFVQVYHPGTGTWTKDMQHFEQFDYGTPIFEVAPGTVLFAHPAHNRMSSYNVGAATMTTPTQYSIYNHGKSAAVVVANKSGTLLPLLFGGPTSANGEYYNP